MRSTTKAKENTIIKTTALHQAALSGDSQAVFNLQQKNTAFNRMLITPDADAKNLPLDRAAARGHYAIVKMLVRAHKTYPGHDYVMHNDQSYTPFLSAVRWYCKVIDGTYNIGKVVGVFNTTATRHHDYLELIKLLMISYPDHIHQPDSKGCNALYYVVLHLANAIEAGDDKNARAIKNLASLLIKSGVSLDQAAMNGLSARDRAREHGILFIIQSLENESNLCDIEGKIVVNDAALPSPEVELKAMAARQLKIHHISRAPVISLSSTLTLPLHVPNQIKTQKSLTMKNNTCHHLYNNPQPVVKKTAGQEKHEFLKFLLDNVIFAFKHSTNYQGAIGNNIKGLNNIKENIWKILHKYKVDSQYSLNNKQQKKLVKQLAGAISVESMTTGFLCCKKTKYWIEIDEDEFCYALRKTKKWASKNF